MPPDTMHERHEITYVVLLLNRHVLPEPNHKETLRPSQAEEHTTKQLACTLQKLHKERLKNNFSLKESNN